MLKLKILVGIIVFSGIVLGWYGVKNSSKTIVVKNAPVEDSATEEMQERDNKENAGEPVVEELISSAAEKTTENDAAENSQEEKSASGAESKIENKEAEESEEIKEVEKVEKEETENKEVVVVGISERLISWGYQNSSGRKIDTIIIHSSYDALGDDPYDTDGLIKEYKQYGVAAHYLIDRQGKIYRLVKDKNIAYHAGVAKVPDGRTEVNNFSIGIELMNTKTDKYTPAQYGAVKNLVAGLKEQYKIKYVLGHDQIAPGRKDDPWNFDWSKL